MLLHELERFPGICILIANNVQVKSKLKAFLLNVCLYVDGMTAQSASLLVTLCMIA
jgi:hypothetical protein